ncbi:hypothetical protein ABET51_09385 [Metabacillus fastidiosus]|uniref:hypothetical protein n=1 Tax=Metabacillus fastidiosus TaxID=1458 RepID=UPI003D269664
MRKYVFILSLKMIDMSVAYAIWTIINFSYYIYRCFYFNESFNGSIILIIVDGTTLNFPAGEEKQIDTL